MKRLLPAIISLLICLGFAACNTSDKADKDYENNLKFSPGQEEDIVDAFLTIKDNSAIYLTAGTYHFDNLSIAGAKIILLRGDGPDKTILDFSDQSTGGEGIRVTNSEGFIIQDMKLQESIGDLIKVMGSRDVVFRNLHTIWASSDSTSGGYGIYPVLCKNVLIENCVAEGASDSGIYVGQSDSATLRNNVASRNVAGIEIENTTNAIAYDNEAFDNTAGFLVFDLANLTKRGGHIQVYNNNIHDNNRENFAKAGSFGTAWGVGNAPPGSGIVVLAASDLQIHDNELINNNSGAIILASGFSTDDHAAEKISSTYQPFLKNIKISNNKIEMSPSFPEAAYKHRMGQMLVATEKKLNDLYPDRGSQRIAPIIYDGFNTNIMTGETTVNPDSLCIDQKGDNLFVDADFAHVMTPEQWHPSIDIAAYTCQ